MDLIRSPAASVPMVSAIAAEITAISSRRDSPVSFCALPSAATFSASIRDEETEQLLADFLRRSEYLLEQKLNNGNENNQPDEYNSKSDQRNYQGVHAKYRSFPNIRGIAKDALIE